MASKRKSKPSPEPVDFDDPAETFPALVPPAWVDLLEIEELKLVKDGHRMRGASFGNIRSGPNQTIMLSQLEGTAYVTYRVIESGVLVGTSNVATAIPKHSTMAQKFRKTVFGGGLTKKVRSAKKAAPTPMADGTDEDG